MRTMKIAIVLCLFLAAHVGASGRTSVYAVIEKLVFEPNGTTAANAERVQVWGAFAFLMHELNLALGRPPAPPESTSDPLRGYMYFSLPTGTSGQINSVRTELADLNAIAGTGQGVSFGNWIYMGQATASGPNGGVYVNAQDADGRTFSGPLAFYLIGPSGQRTQLPTMLRNLPGAPAPQTMPWTTNIGLVRLPSEGSHAAAVKKLRDALAAK
jgi:hypothetical protein